MTYYAARLTQIFDSKVKVLENKGYAEILF
jgi:hypothetical protein